MIRQLVTFALRFRLIVLLLAAGLLVGGILVIQDSPWDVFPEFAPPQIVIQTEGPGLSTEEVERLVTIPVESTLNGMHRLKTLRSSSAAGLSVVTAIFEDGTPILDARQLVGERLAEITAQLPKGVHPPRMTPLASSTSRLLMIGLTSDQVSPMDLRTWADWTLRRRLQAVKGVALVEVFGGEVKQYQVLVQPEELRRHQVSLGQVEAAATGAVGLGAASYVETANQRLPIRHRVRVESERDIAAACVAYQDGAPLALGQVADVRVGSADKYGDAMINGQSGVLLIVQKQPDFNTLTVTRDVQAAVAELRPALPKGVVLHEDLFRQASFVERAMANLSLAIVLGCVLVALILVAFLGQWRTVVISLVAIPLSLLGAVIALVWFGASMNTMTLGGLAIALGEVVDDAIVDVENVLRRLRENQRSSQPRSVLAVVLDASMEVRSAVVYASFIVMLVFLPVFMLGGLAGTFFRPLGLAYVVAIFVSLLVALTVTPALCLALLSPAAVAAANEPLLVRWIKRGYGRLLPMLLARPRITAATGAAVLAAAVAVVPFFGGEFMPDFREANVVVFMAAKADTSLGEVMRVGRQVHARLLAIDDVRSIAQHTGRASLSEDTWGPNVSELWLALDPQSDYQAVLRQMRATLEEVPGFVFDAKPFLRERIDETLTGTTADVVLRLVGPDLDTLRSTAERIQRAIMDVAGLEDLRVEQQVENPQIEVMFRPRDAARYGLTVGQLSDVAQTLLAGRTVGQVYDQDRVFDVVVRGDAATRASPLALGNLLIDTPSAEKIPLRAVAGIDLVRGPNLINREAGVRRMLVTCNVEERDVASAVTDIQERIVDRVGTLPDGYHLEYAGEYAARSAAQHRLLLYGAASLAGIFVLLYLDFKSVRLVVLVMLSVPLAGVGGVAAVLASGGDVSLGSLVGFVTVFGVAIRNGILLISHYQHLHEVDRVPFGPELIVRGAAERISPILMTSAATALALMPLVVRGNIPGHEIEHPMAVVIVGGLVSSVVLTLFVLPTLYQHFALPAEVTSDAKLTA